MTQHIIEFEAVVPEWGDLIMDIDTALDISEQEAIALAEIKDAYPEYSSIKITTMKEI
jgi:hypothetical protein